MVRKKKPEKKPRSEACRPVGRPTRSAAKLTARQQRFVQEYLLSLNATDAARKAGYSARTADRIGPELLGKTCVAAAIAAAQLEREQRTQITQDWVLTRLRENVERSMQATAVLDREGNETGEYTYEGAVANKALELLGKHLGLFTEKREVKLTGPGGGPIEHTHSISLEKFKALPAEEKVRILQQEMGSGS